MLTQLGEHQERIDSFGGRVVAVAPREPYQALRLAESGFTTPLLLDPDNRLRSALGVADRFPWRGVLSPRGAMAYARAARQARNSDPIWSSITERPVMLALDGEGAVVWSHIGSRIGDYPSVGECLDGLRLASS